MKETEDYKKDIASIRSIMERSVKFISLSGLSGVLSGTYALIGAWIAYQIIYYHLPPLSLLEHPELILKLEITAAAVLIASLTSGILLSLRKAKKTGASLWNATSKQLMWDMAIPLSTGGLLILIFINRGYYILISPACLIFYGLALVQASRSTYSEVMYLGLTDIMLGLVAAAFPGYGLILWATGFGVMHVIYGAVMYFRYER